MPHPHPLAPRVLTAVLLAAVLSPAHAAEPATSPPATAAAAADTPSASAMIMARDPQTGLLRAPTAEEMRALGSGLTRDRQALNFSDEGLKQVELPDGTVMLDLQGRFMSTSTAFVDAQGRLVRQCSDHPGLAFDHADHPLLSTEVRDER